MDNLCRFSACTSSTVVPTLILESNSILSPNEKPNGPIFLIVDVAYFSLRPPAALLPLELGRMNGPVQDARTGGVIALYISGNIFI